LLAKLQLLLAKLQSKPAKLLKKLLPRLLKLLLPLLTLLLLLAKLQPLLAKLQPQLAQLLTLPHRLLLLLLPSNFWPRNEKPAFGPVFFRLCAAQTADSAENPTPMRDVWRNANVKSVCSPEIVRL
jgi:hypothetical protein